MLYLLIAILVGSAGWALAKATLWHSWTNGGRHGDLYCGYCGWGLSRGAGYEVYRWQGEVFCSLACLRRNELLRDREGQLP
jgi:hypothetical protein